MGNSCVSLHGSRQAPGTFSIVLLKKQKNKKTGGTYFSHNFHSDFQIAMNELLSFILDYVLIYIYT